MIDHYCERTGPGLLAEPFNLASSLAFFAVAVLAWRYLARDRQADVAIGILTALIVAVGAASLAWHLFATSWARWLDIAALLAFQAGWLWVYVRRALEFSPRGAGVALLTFGLSLLPATAQAASSNGLPLYLPTLVVLLALGLHRRRRPLPEPNLLLAAAALFATSLALRTVDARLCAAFPLGTHFAWHLLTALVVFLAMRALPLDRARR